VAVAVGGVGLCGADAAGGVTARGGHDVTHRNTHERLGGDTRRGTLFGFVQLVGRVAITVGDQGGGSYPP